MADQVDVENAFLALIGAALYPKGVGLASATGDVFKYFRGWPAAATLDADLRVGVVNISVHPRDGVERNTSRYPKDWQQSVAPAHTLTAAVNGNQVTIGGTVKAGQNVIVLCARNANFAYQALAGDTLSSVAAALAAAAVAAGFAGSSSAGATVTVAGHPGVLTARVASSGTAWREVGRVEKQWQITVWASTPDQRDAAAKVLQPALMGTEFLTLADGSAARLLYISGLNFDATQKEILYRRDFIYQVEYAVSQTLIAPEVGTVTAGVGDQYNPTASPKVNFNN